ncbi:MAG: UDP-N-acetylmuramate--L-alanine ligase [Bacteroidetes bacterium]|nr:UDP-N-acetylmuramate--L-alanine ligase [Bacteroidota bacterium]
MTLKEIQAVYFIGIGGIGMSALARYFHSLGVKVSGYDKTPTPLTHQLEVEGLVVYYDENIDRAPKEVQLVVYTPAIPEHHTELTYYRTHGYSVVKRSDVLQIITAGATNICVAGTHGKTTISTLTAYLLRETGYGCHAFLGGISVNYNTNYWSSTSSLCVVEADEYDRSFHKLSPDYAVISSMDPDHLDIYGTAQNVENAFIEFSGKIKTGGLLLYKYGLKRAVDLKGSNRLSYHVTDSQADVHTQDLQIQPGGYTFDVVIKNAGVTHVINHLSLSVGGLHNVENTLPAVTLAYLLGISDESIRTALAAFRGVKRRFEYIISPAQGDYILIDDYAHHPEELRALISGAKHLFPDHAIAIVFQPHLYSRTRDLAAGFAESLSAADISILLPIYPARELPIEGVSANIIFDKIISADKYLLDKQELINQIEIVLNRYKNKNNVQKMVVITAGAGDIDALLPDLRKKLIHE